MVSALWTAASENDIENLRNLLQDASVADVEITDEMGTTPLIQAVKAGHVDAVSVLLERGADPYHASAEGRPDQLTEDSTILSLLRDAQARFGGGQQMIPPMPQAPPEGVYDPNMQFWGPPPPGMYPYYPGPMAVPHHPAGRPDGSMSPPPHMPYYPPPPMAMGPGNLPPVDIARMIPCRFYPACRYGTTCMFAHPQAQGPPPANGTFYPPGPPAGPYGPYDPAQLQHAYGPGFYPSPPGPGYPAANGPNGIPISPPPIMDPTSPLGGSSQPMMHSGPISPLQSGFPPIGAAPGPVPIPGPNGAYPMPPPPQPYPTNMSSPNTGFPPVAPPTTILPFDPQLNDQNMPSQHPPNGTGHQRRGSARKSFSTAGTNSRKPPCAYFPVGRCRNGDMCRFPHVMPTDPVINGSPMGVQSRGPPRPRQAGVHANGFPPLDETMAQMSLHHGPGPRGLMNGNGGPPRAPRATNGLPPLKQRLPGADEFPTLAGSGTPSAHVSTPATPTGLTAAQVLQAPAPARNSTSSKAPWANGKAQSASASVSGSGPSVNGSVNGDVSESDTKADAPVNGDTDNHVQKPVISVNLPNGDTLAKADTPAPTINANGSNPALKPVIPVKLPLSFAAAANSAVASTPELSVSA